MIGRRNFRGLSLKVTWEQQDTNDLQDIPDSFSPIKVHLIFTQ